MARSQPFRAPSASMLLRLAKLLFTLYIFCALLFTSYDFIFRPAFFFVFHGGSSPTSETRSLNGTSSSDSQNTGNWVMKAAELAKDKTGWSGFDSWGESWERLRGKQPIWGSSNPNTGSLAREEDWQSGAGGLDFSKSAYKQATFPRVGIEGLEWGKNVLQWNASAHSSSVAQQRPFVMSEDFYMSKAFDESLGPSKVIPYYYRANTEFDQEDITITTLVTSNRFQVFAALVERYQGPVSVTIHCSNDPKELESVLGSLKILYDSSPSMSAFVDVHLVVDSFDRQFNMWRNVAKFFARTDYVMMLDVDFWICTDFRGRIRGSEEIMGRLRQGLAAFVVPAFEFNRQEDGLDHETFPTDKSELLDLVRNNKIDMFHKAWVPGHGSTNYTRYYEAQPGEVFKVHGYTHSYEPYVIFKKETPWCDERFIGYGGNKAACLFELYLSGVSFYVMPDDFLIHQSHAYAEKARKHERRYNRKLYTDFREELCFRYLTHFIDIIDTPRAKNLLGECKKIKGFQSTANKLIAATRETRPKLAR